MLPLKPLWPVVLLAALPLYGNESNRGVALPLTVSGGLMASKAGAPLGRDEDMSGQFRAVLYPSFKLSQHWFGYSAIQVQAGGQAYGGVEGSAVRVSVLQAFLSYTQTAARSSWSVKLGQLSSAFGSFPLRYDDMKNPFAGAPAIYSLPIRMRPDQLPCGVKDFLDQWRLGSVYQVRQISDVRFRCGGAGSPSGGIAPATLLGLPGAELAVSRGKVDLRLQLTNSSPANPQNFGSGSQSLQWTAGGGYTIRQGFRIGASAYRGAYLDRVVNPLLPAGDRVENYPARAFGMDVQWAQGRWSAEGEWQYFRFPYPWLAKPPALGAAYAEIKAILGPRWYAAVRASRQSYGAIADSRTETTQGFFPNRAAFDFVLGYRLNRFQVLKFGYEMARTNPVLRERGNSVSIQLVTSIRSLAGGGY